MSGIPSDSVLLPVQAGFAAPASAEMPQPQAAPMPNGDQAPDGSLNGGLVDGVAPDQDAPPLDLSTLDEHEAQYLSEHYGQAVRAELEQKFATDKANLQRTFSQREAHLAQQARAAALQAQQASAFANSAAAKMQAWAKEHGLEGEFATWFLSVQGDAAQQQRQRQTVQTEAQGFMEQQRAEHQAALRQLTMEGDRQAYSELLQDPQIQQQYQTFERLAWQDVSNGGNNAQMAQAAQRAYEDLRRVMYQRREAVKFAKLNTPQTATPDALAVARDQQANRQLAEARGPQQRVTTTVPTGGATALAQLSEEQLTARARDIVKQKLGRDPNNGDYKAVFNAKQELKMQAIMGR